MAIEKVKKNFTDSTSKSTSSTKQATETTKTLNNELVEKIMSGLTGQMTDEKIAAYAESLLAPQLNAAQEAAQQEHDTTVLGLENEIENIAAALTRSIAEQKAANIQSKAALENAALARGMGRSSYTLDTLAGQDNALAQAVRELTEEGARQQGQIQKQITEAGTQNAQTQGRLKTDYASQLAAKMQELKMNQQAQFNQNYMTAVSAAIGSKSDTSSNTTNSGSSSSVSGEFKEPENPTAEKKSSPTTKKKTTVSVNQNT